MKVGDVRDAAPEQWRPGVETRMLVSARSGAATLYLRAVLASPIFEATAEGATETVRRWEPR